MRCCQLMQAIARHCIDEGKHTVGFPGTQHVNQLSLVLFPARQQGQARKAAVWTTTTSSHQISNLNLCSAMRASALMHLARC